MNFSPKNKYYIYLFWRIKIHVYIIPKENVLVENNFPDACITQVQSDVLMQITCAVPKA